MTATIPPAQPFQPNRPCPLDGLRVLDFSRLVAGNMLTLQLADFGAEVIKLEPASGDPLRAWHEDGVAAYWKVYGRNKKSIRLDLRSAEGKAMLARLIPTADVLVESFRPGSMEAAGFGPQEVARLNAKLVFVRISGFGQTGPYAQRPGFGSLVEAMSGFASKNGFADKPPALPNFALADMVSGIQGAFATNGGTWFEIRPDYATRNEVEFWEFALEPGVRYLINPGAVGQPRDGDWRAACAIYDDAKMTVEFCRIPYDVARAQQRIQEAGLPDRLARRLADGR